MTELAQKEFEAHQPGVPKVTNEEALAYLKQLPSWIIVERDNIDHLERVYRFKDFVTALAFTNKVGELAERVGHHPAILTEWGTTAVAWWSHDVGGLHSNDFIMAAKTDEVYEAFEEK
jgi:4a-hydroxytetrahydrobiopterin dehydratase